MVFIYVLKLYNNKYYVGKTDNPDTRIENHYKNNGSLWTKKYKPIKIIEIFEGDKYDEDKYVLKYMDKYGINNVRGGSYSSINLSESQNKHLQHINKSQNDKCFNCGKNGHFINMCKLLFSKDYKSSEDEVEGWSCSYCNKVFETKKGATCHENLYCKNKKYKNKDYTSTKNNKCYRCGRYGHYSNECYANKHINGYYLDN